MLKSTRLIRLNWRLEIHLMRKIDAQNEPKRATRNVTYFTFLKYLNFANMTKPQFCQKKKQWLFPNFVLFLCLLLSDLGQGRYIGVYL